MNVGEDMKKSYHLPTSGQIIGKLFEVLQVTRPSHIQKEIQRYFRGIKIEEPTRKEILYLFIDKILEWEVIPPEHLDPVFVCRWGLKKALVGAIDEYMQKWESVCSKLRYWTIPESRREDLLYSFFRLATIDLAYRIACYRHIANLPRLDSSIPLWALRDSNVSFLKQLKARCNVKPTDSELAGEAGIKNEKTIVAWFKKGNRPNLSNLRKLAEVFTGKIPGADLNSISASLTRHYTIAAFCDNLSELIGRDRVQILAEALFDQINRIMDFIDNETFPTSVEQRRLHWFLQFRGGSLRSYHAPWLKYLVSTEKNLDWKQDMVCVEDDWVSRVFQTNLRFADEGVLERGTGINYLYINPHEVPPDGGYYGALMHKDDTNGISAMIDYISSIYIDTKIDCELKLWDGAGYDETDYEKMTEDQLRNSVELTPDSARDHLNLGVFLGLHGYLPTHFEEGYQHCIEAIECQPKWELPWIETANILLHIGDAARALKLLDDATVYIKHPSTRLIYTRAFAKMMNNEFEEALELFEKAIQMKPDFAPAFENAAFCAFRSGDKIKGNRYAKTARRLGISTTYDRYNVGKTKERHKRNPFQPLCETVMCPDKSCPERTSSEKVRQEFLDRYNQSTPH